MKRDIKLVAVDIDGTFVRNDYSYDVDRFKNIFKRMKQKNCLFVVASGNQYYQLKDIFDYCKDEICFVAENGAYVVDKGKLVYAVDMPENTVHKVIDVCRKYPEILNVLCGKESAYCERGKVSQAFFDLTKIYYHHLKWVEDFKEVNDQILKFAPTVPVEKTYEYYDLFKSELDGEIEPTTSGHGSIDLIMPGSNKATGLKRIMERYNIDPSKCVAFGDNGNDIEMLQYCEHSYAVENASDEAKKAAKYICLSNEEDGVLKVLDQLF